MGRRDPGRGCHRTAGPPGRPAAQGAGPSGAGGRAAAGRRAGRRRDRRGTRGGRPAGAGDARPGAGRRPHRRRDGGRGHADTGRRHARRRGPVRAELRAEERLAASTLSWVSLRPAPSTEVWLALVGSSLPLRDEPRATVSRPHVFLQRFRRLTGRSIDDHGLVLLPGPACARHAFISVHDVARLVVAAVDAPDLDGTVDVGGPEVGTWADVARLFEEVPGRRVHVPRTPATVHAVAQRALASVAPAAATVMGLDRRLACLQAPVGHRRADPATGPGADAHGGGGAARGGARPGRHPTRQRAAGRGGPIRAAGARRAARGRACPAPRR
ncbi:hypothetical protein JOD57_001313 [Geodermatophilus bullaregiensis]|nr:hypothetical protein [Geodermatophilus bullaregiensis]